jgi:DNA replication and repair protein RecF
VKIISLYLRHFRSIEERLFEFSDGVNEIVGPNGHGKTSLLEALFIIMTATSFRTTKLEELIRHKEKGFFIECLFEKEGERSKLSFSFDGSKKRILYNENPLNSSLQLLGKLLGVIATPELQELIKGAPTVRRFFLDLLLGATDPVALHHFSRFRRALKQRNAALKMRDERTLFAWEEELSSSMAFVAEKRAALVQELQPHVTHYSQLLLQEPLELVYELKAEPPLLKAYYQAELLRKRPQEMIVGTTLVGPHRDDLHLLHQSRRCASFSSEGQLRLAALSLKLAEWRVMQTRASCPPLFMIDDFAAFLDLNKRALLSDLIGSLGQVFLTAHEPQDSLRVIAVR